MYLPIALCGRGGMEAEGRQQREAGPGSCQLDIPPGIVPQNLEWWMPAGILPSKPQWPCCFGGGECHPWKKNLLFWNNLRLEETAKIVQRILTSPSVMGWLVSPPNSLSWSPNPQYLWVWLYLERVLKGHWLHACSVMFSSFETPWTVAHQAPLSMRFLRQEYWSGLPFPPPVDLPNLDIEPMSLASPALQTDSLPLCHLRSL